MSIIYLLSFSKDDFEKHILYQTAVGSYQWHIKSLAFCQQQKQVRSWKENFLPLSRSFPISVIPLVYQHSCINYFLVAVIKLHDQTQLIEDKVCLDLWFQRLGIQSGGENMATGRSIRKLSDHISFPIGKRKSKWEEG